MEADYGTPTEGGTRSVMGVPRRVAASLEGGDVLRRAVDSRVVQLP